MRSWCDVLIFTDMSSISESDGCYKGWIIINQSILTKLQQPQVSSSLLSALNKLYSLLFENKIFCCCYKEDFVGNQGPFPFGLTLNYINIANVVNIITIQNTEKDRVSPWELQARQFGESVKMPVN